MATVLPSSIYPAVRRFLVECGLNRTVKVFDKETSAEEEPNASHGAETTALEEMDLTAAVAQWLSTNAPPVNGNEVRKKSKKRKADETAEVTENPTKEEDAEPSAGKKKKKKKQAEVEAEPEVEEAPPTEEEVPKSKKKKQQAAETSANEDAPEKPSGKKKDRERTAGTPFKRVDDDAWKSKIKDDRLLDNTHKAKSKFGHSAGDSWADLASEDMLKVKGKGFRKEMAKKKKASWRGSGALDQGVNSVPFSDSDDE